MLVRDLLCCPELSHALNSLNSLIAAVHTCVGFKPCLYTHPSVHVSTHTAEGRCTTSLCSPLAPPHPAPPLEIADAGGACRW